MPQFFKALTGSFIGKVLGALFIAICIALGIGPDKWATFMIQNMPTWFTLAIAQILFVALAATTFLTVFRPWRWFRRSPTDIDAKIAQGAPQEIIDIAVGDKPIPEIAERDTKADRALAFIEIGNWDEDDFTPFYGTIKFKSRP